MTALIVVLIILLLLGVLGAVIEGLLWLTFAAFVLIVVAAAVGYFKFKSWRSTN